jgi:hypothetical protein
MKRRVLIAKALSHEPRLLFLDEPTAGVDVELRREMWKLVRKLRESGVTVILTTHYIDEAEEMADRIGVISKGEIILVEDKAELMRKLGKKQLTLQPGAALAQVPDALGGYRSLADGRQGWSTPTTAGRRTGIAAAAGPGDAGIAFKDLQTARARWKTSSSAWCTEQDPHEPLRNPRHLPFEMARTWRTLLQSIVSPVVSTSLYFVVFGSAIGSRIRKWAASATAPSSCPGLVMLSLLTQSISNASFGIYFPKFSGTIYELLSAPVSYLEVV